MSDRTSMKSILLLAANPKGTKSLRLQEEEREIKERLRLSGYGKIPINSAGAVRPIDIQQAMLDGGINESGSSSRVLLTVLQKAFILYTLIVGNV